MKAGSMPVLLVDDEEEILLNYGMFLKYEGIGPVVGVNDGRKVMNSIRDNDIAVVVLDLVMPHVSGRELLDLIRREHPEIPVVVMTAVQELESAVECMKHGAFDYLVKPVEKDRFVSSVRNALEVRGLRNEVFHLRRSLLSDRIEHEEAFSSIITRSRKMESIFRYSEAVSKTRDPLCIFGETGVGKELLAQAIYDLSGLRGEFVAVNVAGLDDTMFSDTLFGHRKGAFSGADQDRDGLISRAAGGVLMLDEIGDLSEASQLKLLRLLEEHRYYPLGSDTPRESSARIIACTNRDLDVLVQDGRFRKDLYYRICGHFIHIPPVRERPEDIPLLFDYFLEKAARDLGVRKPGYPDTIIRMLMQYDFPGNVRELQSMVRDGLARSEGDVLSPEIFREYLQKKGVRTGVAGEGAEVSLLLPEIGGRFPTLKEVEEFIILEAMRRSGNRQAEAASLLGISRQALNRRLLKKARKM